NPQLASAPIIALHQHAHCVAAVLGVEHSRRSADAALKLVADHPRAPADVAFLYRATVGRIQRMKGVVRRYVESITVVQISIPGSVEREPACEYGVGGILSARQNCSYSGAHGADADFQRAIARNQRGVSDLNSLNVRDGIQWAGCSVKRHSQITRAGLFLCRRIQTAQKYREYMQRQGTLCHLSSVNRAVQYKAPEFGWGLQSWGS